ncbi:hypothetical protein RchiOBHm_Chr7g0239501 [Rosa chinensis]|uniref:Uncharacterized protein n=1 Tax=Rosa chinensis TaxID=74649 RepID=A0A2P6PHQ0_ROSCH|nr:hypothetical protein RchiOBHm_Chr7g0239501 [Rosa chinensis]
MCDKQVITIPNLHRVIDWIRSSIVEELCIISHVISGSSISQPKLRSKVGCGKHSCLSDRLRLLLLLTRKTNDVVAPFSCMSWFATVLTSIAIEVGVTLLIIGESSAGFCTMTNLAAKLTCNSSSSSIDIIPIVASESTTRGLRSSHRLCIKTT